MNKIFLRHWWATVLRGALAVVFGLVLFWPSLMPSGVLLLLGAFFVENGVCALITAVGDWRKHKHWDIFLIKGLAGLICGLLTFWSGLDLSLALTLIFCWSILTGVYQLVVATWMHRTIGHEWILLVNGIVSLVFVFLLVLSLIFNASLPVLTRMIAG